MTTQITDTFEIENTQTHELRQLFKIEATTRPHKPITTGIELRKVTSFFVDSAKIRHSKHPELELHTLDTNNETWKLIG